MLNPVNGASPPRLQQADSNPNTTTTKKPESQVGYFNPPQDEASGTKSQSPTLTRSTAAFPKKNVEEPTNAKNRSSWTAFGNEVVSEEPNTKEPEELKAPPEVGPDGRFVQRGKTSNPTNLSWADIGVGDKQTFKSVGEDSQEPSGPHNTVENPSNPPGGKPVIDHNARDLLGDD